MKKLLILLILIFPFISGNAQEETDSYRQYMMIYLKPDLQNLETLKANMKEHNETFHNEAPYDARVFSIMSGPYAGWWIWQMGPCTFADLDGRKMSEEHDKHWDNAVLKYVDDYKNFEFWRRDDKLSNLDETDPPYATTRIRFLEINRGEGHRVNGFLTRIKETLAAMPGENYWGVYENMFRQGNKQGRHMATVTSFKTMSEMDEDNQFRMHFEKVHGPNSFQILREDWQDIFSDSYDEYISLMPEMNGIKATE